MDKGFWKDSVGWGVGLWLIGYILGIVLFPFVPGNAIGWIIMPIGVIVTLWVSIKKVKFKSFREYFWLATIWTLIAILFDFFFLVLVFKPADGYYKLDVYLYYALVFLLPVFIGCRRTRKARK